MLIASLALVVAVVAVIVGGLVSQSDEIWAQVESSLQQADTAATGSAEGTSELGDLAQGVVSLLVHGVLGSCSAPRVVWSWAACSPCSCCSSC